MPLATNTSFLGVAKEVTKGTGVAATAFIPYNSFNPVDVIMPLEDKGLRGAMVDVFNVVQGPAYSTCDIAGLVYPDTIPWFLSGIYGDITESGASAPFTHIHAVKNSGDGQPGAKTFADFYGYTGTHTRQFAGQQISEVTFTWNADGMLEYSAKSTGFASTLVAKPTQSFGALPPTANWVATTTVGGGSILNVNTGSITWKRNVNVIHALDGTQAPYSIFVGPLGVTGKLSVIMEDDTELLRYLNNTQPSLTVNWHDRCGGGADPGAAGVHEGRVRDGRDRARQGLRSPPRSGSPGSRTPPTSARQAGTASARSPCRTPSQRASTSERRTASAAVRGVGRVPRRLGAQRARPAPAAVTRAARAR
jgi:hypothetical protein